MYPLPPDSLYCADDANAIHAAVVRWLERAVIGLNLCPFAKSVHVKGQVHYKLSEALGVADLLQELESELRDLARMDPQDRDTTLLIVPDQFADFLAFNAFMERAEKCLRRLQLEGTLQIAHFHPQFVFTDADPDDITNFTNRAPYPILHLIREDSIDRAVRVYPEAEVIYERNMQLLQSMGQAGWDALEIAPAPRICPEPKKS